jgi:hypothetical protein
MRQLLKYYRDMHQHTRYAVQKLNGAANAGILIN